MQARHQNIPAHLRARQIPIKEIIEAKADISQIGWACPFCPAKLPILPKGKQREKSIRHHYATKHKSRDTSLAAIHKARAQRARKDKTSQPVWTAGKKKMSLTLARTNDSKRDYCRGGHQMRKIPYKEGEWPRVRSNINRSTTCTFTCVECLKIGPYDKRWDSPCTGKVSPKGHIAWNRLQSFPTAVGLLLHAWKITKSQADRRFQKLVEDGIEPHPGPSNPLKRRRQNLKVGSLNTGGAPGVWRAINTLLPDLDVLCLQEASLEASELAAVCRTLQQKGYSGFFAPGQSKGGGVLTIVRSHTKHKFVSCHKEDLHQHVLVEVGDWLFLNSYIAPRPGLLELGMERGIALQVEAKANEGNRPWAWIGDFNTIPETMAPAAAQHQGHLIYSQATWNGKKHIDQLWSNRKDLWKNAQHTHDRLSDHRVIQAEVAMSWNQPIAHFALQKQHKWVPPPGYTFAEWREQIEQSWNQCTHLGSTSSLMTLLDNKTPDMHDVNCTWTQFTEVLHQIYSHAAATLEPPANQDFHRTFKQWQQAAAAASPKGHNDPNTIVVPKKIGRSVQSMAERKQYNWLKRASRLLELCHLSKLHLPEAQNLARRLDINAQSFRNAPQLAVQLKSSIHFKQQQLWAAQAQQRQRILSDWRSAMQTNTRARHKWVKQSNQTMVPQIMSHEDALLEDTAVLNAIYQHWSEVWDAAAAQPLQTKLNTILRSLPTKQPCNGRPTLPEFSKARSRLSGAAGPDGWTADEIKCFPRQLNALFVAVTEQWERAGCTPQPLTFSRQVNLAKTGKIADGCCQVSNLRPINVYSLWYRWWASTWASCNIIKDWRHDLLPPEICGGPSSPGSEWIASKLSDALPRYGFLCTVDYSLAFDHVDGYVACQALKQAGVPAGLHKILLHQWTNQRRLLQWQQSTRTEILTPKLSIPQGDPLSPMTLNLIMAAGHAFVQQDTPAPAHHRLQAIYMDDRTWVTSSPQLLIDTLQSWTGFSNAMGLKENPGKTQLTYSCGEAKKQLYDYLEVQPHLRQKMLDSAVILGICTIGTSSKLHPKERTRLEEGKKLCARIGKLPVAHHLKLETIRCLAISKSAYGWVNKTPPKTVMENFNKKARTALKSFRGGCIHLRALLVGATSSLDMVIGSRQVLLYLQRKTTERWNSFMEQSSFLATQAKKFLHSTGWNQVGNTWRHAHVAEWMVPPQLPPNDRGAIAHKLREGWRAMHWDLFRYGPRREAALLRDQPFNPSRFEVARQVASNCYGTAFGIMCGAFLSPALHAQRPDVGLEHAACPFCPQPMADHNHIFWQCNRRPNCIRTCQPKDSLQRRFGWPTNQGDENDTLLLEAMTEVAEMVQEHRSKVIPASSQHWQSSITYRPKGLQLINFYKVKKKPKTAKSRRRVQRQQ